MPFVLHAVGPQNYNVDLLLFALDFVLLQHHLLVEVLKRTRVNSYAASDYLKPVQGRVATVWQHEIPQT